MATPPTCKNQAWAWAQEGRTPFSSGTGPGWGDGVGAVKVEMGCVEGEGRALRELVGAAGAAASRNPSLLPRLAAPVAPRLFTTVITLVMT